MEFKVEQKKMDAALSAIAGALKEKAIPVLANVLIESVGEGWLRITATDMDVTLRMDCEAEIIQAGAICVEGRRLTEVTHALPSVTMHFTREANDWVTVLAGKARYRFAGVERDRFPSLIDFPRSLVKLPLKTVQDMIRRTSFAMEPPRGNGHGRKGVRFEIYSDHVRTVALDVHLLPIADAAIEDGEDMIFLLPAAVVPEVLKLTGDEIGVGADINHVFIECGDLRLVTRKVTGDFPGYEAMIPKDANSTATFDAGEMADAVRRASLMSDSVLAGGFGGKLKQLSLAFTEDDVAINSVGREGEGEEHVAASLDAEPITIGFNAEELIKVLGAFDGKYMIHFADAEKPVMFTPEGKDDYQCIATLVRVNKAEPTMTATA